MSGLYQILIPNAFSFKRYSIRGLLLSMTDQVDIPYLQAPQFGLYVSRQQENDRAMKSAPKIILKFPTKDE